MTPDHGFIGYHLIANYTDCCEESIKDIARLRESMINATKASGATILDWNEHIFPNGGFSMILLLSESHATIHTYPEFNSCFIDIFTCGTVCQPKEFEAEISSYLKPKKSCVKTFLRNGQILNYVDFG